MKTLGLIGGIGPESTVEYYRTLVASYRARQSDGSYPAFFINNINMTKMRELIEANELEEVTEYLSGEVEKLARAGADFGALAANTPHLVFAELSRRTSIPLNSIVEATCEAAQESGFQKLGLFGTRFTMQAGFYQEPFSKNGMTLVLPDEAEQEYIHDRYMNELVNGIFLPETRARLLEIAARLKEQQQIQALILGGTELPLILRDADAAQAGIPFLDTTQIHVKSILAQLLS